MRISKRNNVVAAIVMAAGCIFCPLLYAQTAAFDPAAKAQDLSGKVGAKFGSAEGIRQNAVNPMTTGGSSMTNINGDTSFNAPLVICPSSKKFLDVTIIPGASGDIDNIYVQQDTNFDSIFDYSYSVPALVSGLCGNGIISCNAGTWNNCSYYKWTADATGKTSLLAATMQDLGGCFCINNSCGNSLVVNQLSYVLSVLGGGIAGSIQAVNPKWAVSSSSVVDMTISYFGQNSDQCASPPSPWATGSPNPQQYYGSSVGALEGDAQTEATAQLGRNDSGYSILMNSVAAQANPSEYRSCSIMNTATVQTNSAAPDYFWQPWLDLSINCLWDSSAMKSCFFLNEPVYTCNIMDPADCWISYTYNNDGTRLLALIETDTILLMMYPVQTANGRAGALGVPF